MSVDGPVPVVVERFVEDDRIYLINDNYVEIKHRPGFGWFEEDDTVFLREQDSDTYEARYGGYFESCIIPSFQAVITGLSD